jgi:hypothetical protein
MTEADLEYNQLKYINFLSSGTEELRMYLSHRWVVII